MKSETDLPSGKCCAWFFYRRYRRQQADEEEKSSLNVVTLGMPASA